MIGQQPEELIGIELGVKYDIILTEVKEQLKTFRTQIIAYRESLNQFILKNEEAINLERTQLMLKMRAVDLARL